MASERMDPFDLVKNSWRKKELMQRACGEAKTGREDKAISVEVRSVVQHSPRRGLVQPKALCGQAEAGRTQSCQQRKGPVRWGSRGMTTACRDRGAGHGHRRTAWAAQGTGMGSS